METQNAAGSLSGALAANYPQRERYFDERSPTEQIEVLLQTVVQQSAQIDRLQAAVHKLSRHAHGSDGRMLIEYDARHEEDRPRLHRTPYQLRKRAEVERNFG